jgi:hypothetical protein
MDTIERISPINLFICFGATLMALTLISAFSGFLAVGEFFISTFILIINIIISVVAAWPIYRYWFHTKMSMDDEQFNLEVGKREKVTGRWSEFDEVSLVHLGRGRMGVRLYYRDKDDFVEIPASDLKLDASSLRFKAIKLTRAASK